VTDTQIVAVPQIPEGLRQAAAIGYLRPFIGAGVSRLAGCPDWNGFADQSLRYLVDRGKLSHAEADLLRSVGPKVKLAVAVALAQEHGVRIDFESILHPTNWTRGEKGLRAYRALSRLSRVFVTTNYDRWLDEDRGLPVGDGGSESGSHPPEGLRRRSVNRPSELSPADLSRLDTVVHLHGSLDYPEQMVLTMRQYLVHYANDRMARADKEENRVLTFLEHLFQQYSVLFVGYGLDELEILEYVIQKARHGPGGGETLRHFMLQGYFTHQLALMRRLEAYYRDECGVQLIPFSLDGRGYDQLIEVLEEFARQIPATSPLVMQEKLEMKALLKALMDGPR
jgi:hypothetical protein